MIRYRDRTFKALGQTGEVGNDIQTLGEVSEMLLIRTVSACTLFSIRDVLQAGQYGV